MSASQRCSHRVYEAGWNNYHYCRRNGKVERDGKPYCNQHDPEKVEARRQKREQDWQKELDEEKRTEKRRKAEKIARRTIIAVAYGLRGQDARLVEAFETLMANSSWTPEDARALLAELEGSHDRA
jgi:hypothetical protein